MPGVERVERDEPGARAAGRRPHSVGAALVLVRRGLVLVRSAESALFGLAAALVTLAAAARSGAALGAREAWLVAACAGAAAGGAWWLAQVRPRAELGALARELDRRLRQEGALATAWDAERRAADSACARSLRRAVLERLRVREALRAVLPPVLPTLAALLFGAFLLALASEHAGAEGTRRPRTSAELAAGLLRELEELRAAAEPNVDQVTSEQLAALESRLREELAELERAGPERETASTLAALEQELGQMASALASQPAAQDELSAAQAWLDATARAIERELGASAAGGNDSGVTGAGPEGTMSSAHPPGTAGAAPVTPPFPEPATTAAGSWWPREHDPVVERWIESRRRALSSPRD